MSLGNATQLEDNAACHFELSEDGRILLFTWKRVEGLSVALFKRGIADFAQLCQSHRPDYAVIDAAALDQASPAVAWLRSQDSASESEDYNSWWMREIVPLYRDAGVSSLAVATGDPGAPGELSDLPPAVSFRMGYFPDLETSLEWRPA